MEETFGANLITGRKWREFIMELNGWDLLLDIIDIDWLIISL
jgi:hypothetical protein